VVRVIPEALGFGPLLRQELNAAAAELAASQAGLIVVGPHPTSVSARPSPVVQWFHDRID